MAATIGVLIAGGWSVLMVRSGGLGLMRVSEADSLQLTEAIVGTDTSRRVDVVRGCHGIDEHRRHEHRRDGGDGRTRGRRLVRQFGRLHRRGVAARA
jgi:hypothetical protein